MSLWERHLVAIHGMSPNARKEWLGALAVLAFTAWLISHAHPELWITSTWSSGGDVASQVFYAAVFANDWFFNGKISGWLPESFAGFPAFTYYFPLPFSLIALLSPATGTQVAFKIISMSPAFLLPAATYVMLGLWRLPVALRLAGLVGAAGFILTEETSIWGGNILSQLAGEFAYSWGMFFVALFWGVLVFSWRRGKGWWLAAATLEAAVALSHGYALLMAGFGAFALLFLSSQPWRDFRTLLLIHGLAFLLIGFWLVPLIQNLPWTIPNDTSMHVDDLKILWPRSLWPLAVGVPVFFFAVLRVPSVRAPLIALCLVSLLGWLGFFAGHTAGLAELRFFPYAQWAAAIACAIALGWLATRAPLAEIPVAAAFVLAFTAWWEPHIQNPEGWSHWNLSGYEAKPMWPVYQQLAEQNSGPLSGPRVIFEHDPDNNDLGSTRSLEALPMFGSRPALEGLYMESSITSPFIYQLQEQISKRPSSPLSRYPTTPRSLDHAVRYLNELYTNRLILRSQEMKQRYAADPRFRLVSQVGPFHILELIEFDRQLVEVCTDRLVARSPDKWLDEAFRRFAVSGRYDERFVYPARGQAWSADAATAATESSADPENRPRLIEFERERLVFETDQVGRPHMIRMTYHPRWRSSGGEAIYPVEPSFMLIVPQQSRVELTYAWSWGDYLGAVFSVVALGLIALALARRRGWFWPEPSASIEPGAASRRPLIAFGLVGGLAVAATTFTWWSDPEHVYARGHRLFAENQWSDAAALFEKVTETRRVPAARAEALFWAARSHDLAGEIASAEPLYLELSQRYPENFWYPEAVHRLMLIAINRNQQDPALALFERLSNEVPESRWTIESRKALTAANFFSGGN